ncbi:MAG: type II toxin-antitoxin system HicB family antitoxin [Crocosphaera sp.]
MLLVDYCEKALKKAKYKQLKDGTWFAEIDGFQGVWGNGLTIEECRQDLLEVLEEWIILKLQDGDTLPIVDNLELKVTTVSDI